MSDKTSAGPSTKRLAYCELLLLLLLLLVVVVLMLVAVRDDVISSSLAAWSSFSLENCRLLHVDTAPFNADHATIPRNHSQRLRILYRTLRRYINAVLLWPPCSREVK